MDESATQVDPSSVDHSGVDHTDVGRGVRAFVAVFLTIFVTCGLFQVEAWPFSGWRLFSELRTDEVEGWLATAVDAGGTERPVPFGSFPDAFRGQRHVLKGFADLSPGDQRAVCQAWATEMADEVVEIRIYATTDSARNPDGGSRMLRHTCPDL